MVQFSKAEIQEMDEPGFLVNVVVRNNGHIHNTYLAQHWEDAKRIALSAIEDKLTVEMEEHF